MKKVLIVLCLFMFGLFFVGCYQDLQRDNLDEYIYRAEKGGGYSNMGLDDPNRFLPTTTFFGDYDYIEGKYAWRQDDLLRELFQKDVHPEITFLYLRYEEEVYINAKQCMLENMEPYNELYYEYNDYIFYENSNFIEQEGVRTFPEYFTMACYNDEECALIFIGFDAYTKSNKKYVNYLKNDFPMFIDTYYGVYHDFNQ